MTRGNIANLAENLINFPRVLLTRSRTSELNSVEGGRKIRKFDEVRLFVERVAIHTTSVITYIRIVSELFINWSGRRTLANFIYLQQRRLNRNVTTAKIGF